MIDMELFPGFRRSLYLIRSLVFLKKRFFFYTAVPGQGEKQNVPYDSV